MSADLSLLLEEYYKVPNEMKNGNFPVHLLEKMRDYLVKNYEENLFVIYEGMLMLILNPEDEDKLKILSKEAEKIKEDFKLYNSMLENNITIEEYANMVTKELQKLIDGLKKNEEEFYKEVLNSDIRYNIPPPLEGGKNLNISSENTKTELPAGQLSGYEEREPISPAIPAGEERSSTRKRGVTPETSVNPHPLGRGRGQNPNFLITTYYSLYLRFVTIVYLKLHKIDIKTKDSRIKDILSIANFLVGFFGMPILIYIKKKEVFPYISELSGALLHVLVADRTLMPSKDSLGYYLFFKMHADKTNDKPS